MTAAEIRVRHATVVDAPPAAVYELITDVSRWPVLFRPTVHTRVLARSSAGDRFEIWATVSSGEVSTWRSRREFDPAGGRVTFGQDHDNALFGHMGGGWTCVPRAGGGTEVVLEHRYHPSPDQADAKQRIARELDHNSSVELEALRTVATLPGGVDRWLLTFSESTELAGSVAGAREFVWDADRWPERLPHVAGLELVTRADGTQDMTMRTRAPDGSEHTTRSVRVLLADGSIVYKQTRPPRALLGHAGRWEFRTDRSGASIRSTHTFLLDPVGMAAVFGPEVAVTDAMTRVRAALSANSRVTMEHASRHAASTEATR
jgi:aromatase